MIKVLSVDDHPLLREGIAVLVNAESDMKLIAEAKIREARMDCNSAITHNGKY